MSQTTFDIPSSNIADQIGTLAEEIIINNNNAIIVTKTSNLISVLFNQANFDASSFALPSELCPTRNTNVNAWVNKNGWFQVLVTLKTNGTLSIVNPATLATYTGSLYLIANFIYAI